jgi:pyridoxal phosphate enzyme (YggS family)
LGLADEQGTISGMMTSAELQANLEAVEARISRAAARAGRSRAEITLVAVTKTLPVEVLALAYDLGLRDFGENRAEEALPKQATLPRDVRWHMIGHIQSRKAKQVAGAFWLIHSVDSLKLAAELARRAAALPDTPILDILLQVNVSGEAQKSGFQGTSPDEVAHFIEEAAQAAALPLVRVRGLMTMAPFLDDAEQTRPVFAAMRQLQGQLQHQLPNYDWQTLSMGMTNDFEVAIAEGATCVRVGTALFGTRAPNQG